MDVREAVGGTRVVVRISLAREEKITSAFVVPTMLSRIVDALEGEASAAMPHLDSLSYGGGKMPLSVIERAMAPPTQPGPFHHSLFHNLDPIRFVP